MSKAWIFGFVVCILLASICNVLAFGITPGRTTIDFSPGLNKTIVVNLLNSEHKDMNVVVSIKGELKSYITPKEMSFEMKKDEESKQLTFELALPDELKPGTRTGEIYILQLPETALVGESYVGAALALTSQINVNVPYPGKYAEADLNVIEADENGEVTFIIPVVNKGTSNLVNVYANIDIYNKMGRRVASFNTESIGIKKGARGEIVERWNANVPFGHYNAIATVIYDGEGSITLGKEFDVGAQIVELKDVKVNNFVLGGIAKFEMLVENKWSEKITDAYTRTEAFDKNGVKIANFKSSTADIDALSSGVLYSYWDTSGVEKGTYDASIYLNYGTKSMRKDVKFEVKENAIEIIGLGYVISAKKEEGLSTLMIVLIILIIVLIVINLSWFLFLRNRLKEKNRGHHGV